MGQQLVKLAITSGNGGGSFRFHEEDGKNFVIGVESIDLPTDNKLRPEGCSFTIPMSRDQAIEFIQNRRDMIPASRRYNVHGISLRNQTGEKIIQLAQPV